MSAIIWNTEPLATNNEERVLLGPLLAALVRRRWIGPKSVIRTEVSLNGRRIDLAVLGSRGQASSFELKLGSFHRALEQAMYNRLTFDRSWIVVSETPRSENLSQAVENGVGVMVLDRRSGTVKVLSPALKQDNPRYAREKVRAAIAGSGVS